MLVRAVKMQPGFVNFPKFWFASREAISEAWEFSNTHQCGISPGL